jgi:DNA mismatch repair protein MutS2
MDDRTLRVLEFGRIREMLMACASTELGKERCVRIVPQRELALIQELQAGTSEARRLLDFGKQIPLGGIQNITDSVDKADRGGMLHPEQLLDVLYTLESTRRLKKAVSALGPDYPILMDMAAGIETMPRLEDAIANAISETAEVLDSASSELRAARVKIRSINNKIRDTLDSIVRSPQWSKVLQDPVVSLRNGRFVVPVKSEMRGQAAGIVHDQSSSGATLFIEPMAVVELNNQLRQAVAAEEAEIERILTELSAAVAEQSTKIIRTLRAVTEIDYTMAKGKLSYQMDATAPELNTEGRVSMFGARHPLLGPKVVPIDPHLGKTFSTLVITGPNTGGKTVTLKTVGLLTLMAQAGLHVPAEPGTEIAVFGKVFADIGDEQSIEQSLSTFSSHLTHIIDTLREADSDSLVLLDELGAGTDPQEGAALAMAILEELHSRGARTVATTHYSELKAFAHTTPGLANASVEFDVDTLRPTYKLSIGIPGASNAFAISQRLGLPEEVLDRARSLVGSGGKRMEEMISTLKEDHERAAAARADAEALRRRYLELMRKYEALASAAQAERATALKRAREEAEIILRQATQDADKLIGKLRAAVARAQADGGKPAPAAQDDARDARRGLDDLRSAVRELTAVVGVVGVDEHDEGEDPLRDQADVPIRAGGEVEVISFGQRGTVLEALSDDEFAVAIGSMRMNVKRSQLRPVRPAPTAPTLSWTAQSLRGAGGSASIGGVGGVGGIGGRASGAVGRGPGLELEVARSINSELDLRGMRVDEALEAVDKYIDDAMLSSLPAARIIHGKGTGALREAVRAQLSADRRVASTRPGEAGEGGDGVTVVSFAK